MPGSIDTPSGVYVYAADDIRSPMHQVLNLGQNADKVQRKADRDRLTAAETQITALQATGSTIAVRTANGATPSTSGTYTWVPVTWQTVDGTDELGAFKTATPNRLIVNQTGLYHVIGVARVGQTSGALATSIRINNSLFKRSFDDAVGSSARFPVLRSEIPSVLLQAGDEVDLAIQTTLASQTIYADRSYLSLRLLRAIA